MNFIYKNQKINYEDFLDKYISCLKKEDMECDNCFIYDIVDKDDTCNTCCEDHPLFIKFLETTKIKIEDLKKENRFLKSRLKIKEDNW